MIPAAVRSAAAGNTSGNEHRVVAADRCGTPSASARRSQPAKKNTCSGGRISQASSTYCPVTASRMARW